MPLPYDVTTCFAEAQTAMVALKASVQTTFECANQALCDRVAELERELQDKREDIRNMQKLEAKLRLRDAEIEKLQDKVRKLEEEAAADAAVSGQLRPINRREGPPSIAESSSPPCRRATGNRNKSLSPSEAGNASGKHARGARQRSPSSPMPARRSKVSRSRDQGSDGEGKREVVAAAAATGVSGRRRGAERDSSNSSRRSSPRSPERRRGGAPRGRSRSRSYGGDRPTREKEHGEERRDALCIPFVLSGGCKLGDKCWNRHPQDEDVEQARQALKNKACRFGAQCKRSDCIFRHDGVDEKNAKRSEKPNENRGPTLPLCRYGDNCKRPDCKFRHEWDRSKPWSR
jgi:hypothetical protein